MKSIKDLAVMYNTDYRVITKLLIRFGIIEKKGSKGNRPRLLPCQVEKLIQNIGAPLK
jgi:hypothetical protein